MIIHIRFLILISFSFSHSILCRRRNITKAPLTHVTGHCLHISYLINVNDENTSTSAAMKKKIFFNNKIHFLIKIWFLKFSLCVKYNWVLHKYLYLFFIVSYEIKYVPLRVQGIAYVCKYFIIQLWRMYTFVKYKHKNAYTCII